MNKLQIKINGLNLSRLINKLVDAEIFLNDLIVKNGFIKFSIYEQDLEKVKAICKFERKNIIIVNRRGVKKCFKNLNKTFGFVLAMMLVSCYLLAFNCFVFRVEITGVSESESLKIENILSDNGIRVGMLKNEISVKEIEEVILKNYDKSKGCKIKTDGGCLNIFLYDSAIKNELVKTEIRSKYDAVVTKINVYSGESKFKVGDVVRMGDLLIEDDVSADGDVIGKVSFSATKIYNENQIKQVRTGKYSYAKHFTFRNKSIVKPQNNNHFSNYIVEKCDFYILDNYFLPIKCEMFRFAEVENIYEIIPFAGRESEIKNELYNDVVKSVANKDSVINVSYSVISEGSIYRIDCFVECEINLAK